MGLSKGDARNTFGTYHSVITTHTACMGPGDPVTAALLGADVLTELMTGRSVPCHPHRLPGHPGRQWPRSSSGLLQALWFLLMPRAAGLIHSQTPEGSGSLHLSPHTHPAGQTGTGHRVPRAQACSAHPFLSAWQCQLFSAPLPVPHMALQGEHSLPRAHDTLNKSSARALMLSHGLDLSTELSFEPAALCGCILLLLEFPVPGPWWGSVTLEGGQANFTHCLEHRSGRQTHPCCNQRHNSSTWELLQASVF